MTGVTESARTYDHEDVRGFGGTSSDDMDPNLTAKRILVLAMCCESNDFGFLKYTTVLSLVLSDVMILLHGSGGNFRIRSLYSTTKGVITIIIIGYTIQPFIRPSQNGDCLIC